MAIDLVAKYGAGKTNPVSGGYSTGSIKNETTPNVSDDGTPLDEAWGNDFEGLKQAALDSAGRDITGQTAPDSITNPEILDALRDVVPVNNRFNLPVVSIGTDTDHDVDVTAGKIIDLLNEVIITGPALTKQIDVAWVAGDNAGGFLPGGGVQATTTYYLFAMRKTDSGAATPVDYGFDDITNSNIPAGYTVSGLVAIVRTDGSANILTVINKSDEFDAIYGNTLLSIDGQVSLPVADILTTADAATKSEQEAAASLLKFTTPGTQHYSPSAISAWASTPGSSTVNQGFNIGSVTDTAVGQYIFNWGITMTNGIYGVLLGGQHDLSGVDGARLPGVSARTTTTTSIRVTQNTGDSGSANIFADSDPTTVALLGAIA